VIIVLSLVYLVVSYNQTGDIIKRDVSLAGGTTLTLEGDVDSAKLESELKNTISDVSFKKLSDLRTGKQIAFIIETSESPEQLTSQVESILGYNLTKEDYSVEFTGSSLSENFYKQLLSALIISFILMALVIFIMFRSVVPSTAIVFAAFADILMPLAILNYLEVRVSAAGIAAFLMLIGYCVDTNILLTTRALKKKEGTLNERLAGAFNTGILMNLTALFAVLPAFFLITGLPDSFKQIFLILALGLSADIINTWLTNASIIKWYCEKKGIK
jgi:preprotein translocase subunit SecF